MNAVQLFQPSKEKIVDEGILRFVIEVDRNKTAAQFNQERRVFIVRRNDDNMISPGTQVADHI